MTLMFPVENVYFYAVLSAVVTVGLSLHDFSCLLFSVLGFLKFSLFTDLLNVLVIILIVLVCTLFLCKFGYFSYSVHFVSDD